MKPYDVEAVIISILQIGRWKPKKTEQLAQEQLVGDGAEIRTQQNPNPLAPTLHLHEHLPVFFGK